MVKKINFLLIFAVPSSSRHKKCCRMLEIIFAYFNVQETHSDMSMASKQVLRTPFRVKQIDIRTGIKIEVLSIIPTSNKKYNNDNYFLH